MRAPLNAARIALILTNTVLMLIAIALLGGGIVLVLGKTAYGSELEFLRRDLSESATSLGATALDVSQLDVTFVTRPLGISFLVFGAITLTIAILGIIVGAGDHDIFVIVYSAVVGVIFFCQFVVIICAYIDRTPFDSTIKSRLKTSILDWTGIDGEDSTSLGWNAIMSYFRCCGVDDYTDAAASTKWTRQINGVVLANLETPSVCCEIKTNLPICATTPNFQTQTYSSMGCYEQMFDYVTSRTGVVIFTVFFVMVFETTSLFLAIWLICDKRSGGGSKIGVSDDHS